MLIAQFPALADVQGDGLTRQRPMLIPLSRRSPRGMRLLALGRRSRRRPCWSPLCRRSRWNPFLLRCCPELCGGPWRRSPRRARRCLLKNSSSMRLLY